MYEEQNKEKLDAIRKEIEVLEKEQEAEAVLDEKIEALEDDEELVIS